MTTENSPTRLQTTWTAIKKFVASPLFSIVVVAGLLFFVISMQRSCHRRREEIEDEKIKSLETELQQRKAEFEIFLSAANRDHETTTAILNGMEIMTRNISTLAENDKAITARVNEIAENEYAAARSQKINQSAVKTGKAKTAKPLRTREIEALKVDEELYPNE